MPRLDHIPDNASPVSVSQAGLIRLNGPARAIALDVFRIQLLQGRPVSSRMAMERPIRPLLVPACAAGAE